LLLLWVIRGGEGVAAEPAASESLANKAKAAYLFNFAKYLEWPAATFKDAESPILIGVLGQDPFGGILEETISDRLIGKRKVQVRRGITLQEMKDCHVLYISTSERGRWHEIFKELKGSFA